MTAARRVSIDAGSREDRAASSTAALTEVPICCICARTPCTVATVTSVTRPKSPSTTAPAAMLGFSR